MQAYLAQRNITTTLILRKSFQSIPDQAKDLRNVLDNDERKIKFVYKGLRKLRRLKAEAERHKRSFSSAASKKGESAEFQDFHVLNDVVDELEQQLLENVEDMCSLALQDPVVLIRSLEVCARACLCGPVCMFMCCVLCLSFDVFVCEN